MKQKILVSVVAFGVIFLSALFLFIRNYPSDRSFSLVFVVAGGVLVWGGLEDVESTNIATTTMTTTMTTGTEQK
jgi:hypothetical protein